MMRYRRFFLFLFLTFFALVGQKAYGINCQAIVTQPRSTTTMDASGNMQWVFEVLYFPVTDFTHVGNVQVTTLQGDTPVQILTKITTAIVNFGANITPVPCTVARTSVLIPSYVRGF